MDLAVAMAIGRTSAGLKLIQILPVNDTSATHTWMDSYPHAGISGFALHPLYLNLDRMAGDENGHLLVSLARERKQLNGLANQWITRP